MREWIAVAIAGGIGGIGATFFAEHYDAATSEPPHDWSDENWARARHWTARLARNGADLALNIFGGALASFILWATYTSSLTFDSTRFSSPEVAASITVGLGGVGAVRGLMTVAQRAGRWERLAKRSMQTLVATEEGTQPRAPVDNAEREHE